MSRENTYFYNGQLYTTKELASLAGVGRKHMSKRLKTMTVEEAVTYKAPPKNASRTTLHLYKGEMISVKEFCSRTGMGNDTAYRGLKEGKTLEQIESDYRKPRNTNNRIPVRYQWKDQLMTVNEIASLEGIDSSTLYKRINSGLNIDEAVEIIKRNKPKLHPYNGKMVSKHEIVTLNPEVSDFKLSLRLLDDYEYTEEQVLEIIEQCKKTEYYKIYGQSLYQYCINNQYNYYVIRYLMISKKLTTYEAVSRYLEDGQEDPAHGKYFTGNILLSHFCIKSKLDVTYIKRLLNSGMDMRRAVSRCCFNSNTNYATKSIRLRLCSIYEVWEILNVDDRKFIEEHYKLSNDDIEFMNACDCLIKKILKEYDLLRLSYYLESADDNPEIQRILKDNRLSITTALELLDSLYTPFEYVEKSKDIKYKWKARKSD